MMTIDQIIEVTTAFKAGKTVQVKLSNGWFAVTRPTWNFDACTYRVKPEPPVTVFDKVQALIANGHEFRCGPHTSHLIGYHACFHPGKFTEDSASWEESGHGLTIMGAIIMAVKLADGETVAVPRPEEFNY